MVSARRVLPLLLPVASLMLLPASAAAARVRCLPDLVIASIVVKQLPGTPPYIVVDSDGTGSGFVVDVVTRNKSRTCPAKRSRTELQFVTRHGTTVHGESLPVPALAPTARHTSKFKIDDLRPPLGWLYTEAQADVVGTVQELDNRNNTGKWRFKLGPGEWRSYIPVIARQWKAIVFRITENQGSSFFPGGVTVYTTQGGQNLVFRFSTFDEAKQQFEYFPSGTIQTAWDFSYPPADCSGHAGTSKPSRHWPGHLWLDNDLFQYDGFVQLNDEQGGTGTISCQGKAVLPAHWGWQDLETFIAPQTFPEMSPSDTRLTGQTIKNEAGVVTTWSWTFQADVPGA